MELEFSGEVIEWRGPSPFHFVEVPDPQSAEIEAVADVVSYGWGCIPVRARIDDTTWKTSLFPRDGLYLVPIKDKVRKAAGVELGDVIDLELTIDVRAPTRTEIR